MPAYESLRVWKDRRVLLERPLFPGYIFVQLSSAGRKHVTITPGVLQIICSDYKFDRIDDGLIALLMQDHASRSLRPERCIQQGEEVTVVSGVFAGVQGVLSGLKANCRVVLTVASIAQAFSIEVRQEEIRLTSKLGGRTPSTQMQVDRQVDA